MEKDTGCRMSYMHPYYIRQGKPNEESWSKYSKKYALYLYREGGLDFNEEAFRIPILFIPGHAGSYKQARSLARASAEAHSELLKNNPDIALQGNIGLDYFTVDLNEELTALHGRSLQEQAEFVNESIKYILSLYKNNRKRFLTFPGSEDLPDVESVIIVGHSMGGLVARAAVASKNHIKGSVNTLITLSTPHVSPTVSLDSLVSKTYKFVNKVWYEMGKRNEMENMVLVSIVGGNMDGMINSDLAYVEGLLPKNNGFTAMTSSVRGVWLSMDHQSILWCRQLVQALARALVDIIDAKSSTQTKSAKVRLEILKQRFLSGDSGLITNNTNLKLGFKKPGFKVKKRSDKTDVGLYTGKTYSDNIMRLDSGSRVDKESVVSVHLLDNFYMKDKEIIPKDLDLQVLISSFASESVKNLEYVHFICCKYPTEGNLDNIDQNRSKDDVFTVNSRSGINDTCFWLPPIRTAAFLSGTRGDASEGQFVELQAEQISKCYRIGLLQPSVSNELKNHSGKILGNRLQVRLIEKNSATALDGKIGLTKMIFKKVEVIVKRNSSAKFSEKPLPNSLRTRLILDVPEDPFLEYKVRVMPIGSSHKNGWNPLCIRQSDAREFESRYWARTNTASLSIHGRGAYISGYPPKPNDKKWNGIYLDIFSTQEPSEGYKIVVWVDLFGSLSRAINRYYISIINLLFIWFSLGFLIQLYYWFICEDIDTNPNLSITKNTLPQISKIKGGSTLASAKNIIFPNTLRVLQLMVYRLKVLPVFVMATPVIMYIQVLARENINSEIHPETYVFIQNLFFGFRGESVYSFIVPLALVVLTFGLAVLVATGLEALCSFLSHIMLIPTKIQFQRKKGIYFDSIKKWNMENKMDSVNEDSDALLQNMDYKSSLEVDAKSSNSALGLSFHGGLDRRNNSNDCTLAMELGLFSWNGKPTKEPESKKLDGSCGYNRFSRKTSNFKKQKKSDYENMQRSIKGSMFEMCVSKIKRYTRLGNQLLKYVLTRLFGFRQLFSEQGKLLASFNTFVDSAFGILCSGGYGMGEKLEHRMGRP
ncbi:hypothetical protein BB559_002335 [Furculomyces boomerangus]|uniref:GPI inositol-deacylase n=2 Tax=Furculomyces boomerangus TaxID=61424 RepID=A0A2T9YWC2_9FUNG|nr:hypothetical protein BB559_002335 [Furculomyces boomerangus]